MKGGGYHAGNSRFVRHVRRAGLSDRTTPALECQKPKSTRETSFHTSFPSSSWQPLTAEHNLNSKTVLSSVCVAHPPPRQKVRSSAAFRQRGRPLRGVPERSDAPPCAHVFLRNRKRPAPTHRLSRRDQRNPLRIEPNVPGGMAGDGYQDDYAAVGDFGRGRNDVRVKSYFVDVGGVVNIPASSRQGNSKSGGRFHPRPGTGDNSVVVPIPIGGSFNRDCLPNRRGGEGRCGHVEIRHGIFPHRRARQLGGSRRREIRNSRD